MSFNSNRQKAFGSNVVALTGVLTGVVTASTTVLAPGDNLRIGSWSLYMLVSAAVHTSSLVVATIWQVSDDNSTWDTLYPASGAAYSAVAASGTGSTVTTRYRQVFDGDPAAYQYVRAAVLSTGATGGASDNVTISHGWLKRFFIPS